MSNVVTQLPPTIGIKDPEVRAYLDALTNAWSLRSGDINGEAPERYVTAGEFKEMATTAMASALSSALSGSPPEPGSSGSSSMLSNLLDEVKRSLIYQMLGTEFGSIDLNALRDRINEAIGTANTLFLQERTQREAANEAVTHQIEIQAGRIDDAESAIATEANTRTSKDNALASAVNTLWAVVGGQEAVIQDGALAAVSPSAVQATKWQQVQAALTDPNTNQVMSTSIKQELNSYVNKVDNTLNSIYSVRVQTMQDGKMVVGGFGVSATGGAGSPGGTSIDFAVSADRFSIVSPRGNNSALVMTNNTINVFDEGGALRVKIGKLS